MTVNAQCLNVRYLGIVLQNKFKMRLKKRPLFMSIIVIFVQNFQIHKTLVDKQGKGNRAQESYKFCVLNFVKQALFLLTS